MSDPKNVLPGLVLETTHIADDQFMVAMGRARGKHLGLRIDPQLTLGLMAQSIGEYMARETIRGMNPQAITDVVMENMRIAYDAELIEMKKRMDESK